MKIVLIRPSRLFKYNGKTMKPSPPLGLAFVAAALEQAGHTVKVIDAIAENRTQIITFKNDICINGLSNEQIIDLIPKDTDIIGLSCMFTGNWPYDRLLINQIAAALPQSTLIAGGEHITALPELALTECPGLRACALGEGEETMVAFCDAIQNNTALATIEGIVFRSPENEIVKTKRRERVRDIEAIPWPAWHLFPTEAYFREGFSFGVGVNRSLPIMATRGCPYLCTFCSSPDMWGRRYLMRSVNDVVNEIEFLNKTLQVDNIDFYDLTAIVKENWIIELAQEIIRRNIKITWQIPAGTRSEAITKEVAHYLKLSGCRNISYAPESGSPEILESIKKKVALDKMLTSISYSSKEGLSVKVNIIIGFPQEKHKHIWQTIFFLMKCSWYGVYDTSPAPFQPYPGTELFTQLYKAGKIDLNTDEYYEDIINSDNFWNIKFYNYNIARTWMLIYFYLCLIAFYGTNYLFRPARFFRLIRNVIFATPISRGEALLSEIYKQKVSSLKSGLTSFFISKDRAALQIKKEQ